MNLTSFSRLFVIGSILLITTLSPAQAEQNCRYNRYDGPCLDVDLIRNEPPMYDECRKFEDRTAREYAACNFGVDEARRMAIRYGGGYGRMHGYLRGFSWGLNKMTRAYQNDATEMQAGRDLVDDMGEYMDAGLKAGRDAGMRQGMQDGRAEAEARFRAAIDSGRLPSDQVGQIPATNYRGEDNGYERFVRNPKTPETILQEDLAGLNDQLRAYDGLDSTFVDYKRGNIWDYWFGDGIYSFETRRWMDNQLALNVWLQRPIDTKPKYQDLNRNAPTYTEQEPVLDPITRKPQIDPDTGKPVTRPVTRTIDLQAIFKQSFVNSYGYYVSYNYSKSLYDGMDQGQASGEAIGILLGKRMAQQAGLIAAFNEKFKSSSQAAFRDAFSENYVNAFESTYAHYKNNAILEVRFDQVIGAQDDGILQPGEEFSIVLNVRNLGGRATPLRVSVEGDVQGARVLELSIGALTSQTAKTTLVGRIDSRLRSGDTAKLQLRVNDLVVARTEVVRRQIEILPLAYTLDVSNGLVSLRAQARNVSTERSAGQIIIQAETSTRGRMKTATKVMGFINPGDTVEQVLELSGVDPLDLIKGSQTIVVTAVMNDAVMDTKLIQPVSRDTRLDLARYFNKLANDQGFVPVESDAATQRASVSAMILARNSSETIGQKQNIWKDASGLGSILGLLVNEYRQTTHSADAKARYKVLATELNKARKNLGKFLFFKSGKRKAYESLVKELER